MKVYLVAAATITIFAMFMVFQADNDQYLRQQVYLKQVANDCSNAASLYYDQEQYADGYKVFDKLNGNKVIKSLLETNLEPHMDFEYYTYYFDESGKRTDFKGEQRISVQTITYPYKFYEPLTEYEKTVEGPIVIVTIDAGNKDYRLDFITDPKLIRTSGHEYVGE